MCGDGSVVFRRPLSSFGFPINLLLPFFLLPIYLSYSSMFHRTSDLNFKGDTIIRDSCSETVNLFINLIPNTTPRDLSLYEFDFGVEIVNNRYTWNSFKSIDESRSHARVDILPLWTYINKTTIRNLPIFTNLV